MDGDSWSARLSSASKRYQSALQSRSVASAVTVLRNVRSLPLASSSSLSKVGKSGLSYLYSRISHGGRVERVSGPDMFMGFEEFDGDYDIREEFPCPFCSEFFDILGLCCHIDDEHQLEARNGVCPVCAMRVGFDMVAHITLQHGNILKMQRKRKSRKGGSHSTLSLLRRELREGTLQSLLGGSSGMLSSTNAAPDPLLSSFISPVAGNLSSSQPSLQIETSSAKKSLNENVAESHSQASPLSDKDREERAKRSEFVSELLWSTVIDDSL